ncbi:MAG TPA: hypothetical protein VHZ04_03730 [Candidatus Paceibacterota bacterium]|jgi:hypothetical protein|nr:hypothetical protein [Candidatus Paceibacterota bacterium]
MSIYKKVLVAIPLIFLLAPALALAVTPGQPNYAVWNPSILAGPLVTCTGTGGSGSSGGTSLPACTSLCDLLNTIANVIYFMIGVVIWILTPIFVAWAGIRFMLSRGNSEGISSARKMITGLVIGLLITLCAYLIVSVFVSVLNLGSYIGGFGTAICSAH